MSRKRRVWEEHLEFPVGSMGKLTRLGEERSQELAGSLEKKKRSRQHHREVEWAQRRLAKKKEDEPSSTEQVDNIS